MSLKNVNEALATKLQSEITRTEHGAFGENSSLFLDNLEHLSTPVTKKMVDDVENAKSEFTAAVSLAHTRLGNEHLVAHKDQDRTVLKVSVGRDELTSTYLRKRESPNPQDRTKTITTYGALSTNYTSVSGVGSKGALKQVKIAAAELAAKTLAD